MITDPLLRFAWVMYIPDPKAGWRHSPSVQLRGWVVTMCEILRRWQWNCTFAFSLLARVPDAEVFGSPASMQ